jgi:glutamate-1-semialdehyde 2,1-aminomutase
MASTRVAATRPLTVWRAPESDEEFRERVHRAIPGGSHTYSRGDDQVPANMPRAFVRGKGAHAWARDGTEFVDWGMGINNVLIGHAEDVIDNAAVAALRSGQALSRPTMRELEIAETIVGLFPGMEMAKFCKNGSDANTAGVRLARAITGRDLVAYDATAPFLSINDWFIGTTVMRAGVPESERALSVGFVLNDAQSVEKMFAEHAGQIAAVVLEVCRERKPAPGFLELLRKQCDEDGALLIFDEIVTGFRYHLSGAQTLYGVTPDFTTVGKAMANGYALAGLLGRRVYMERGGIMHDQERVFLLSTTNGPEQSALAAAIATIAFYREHDVIAHLYSVGGRVIEGLAEAASRHGLDGRVSAASDFDCRPVLRFLDQDRRDSPEYRTLFVQEMAKKRVFMPWICPSYRIGEDELERTFEAFDAACAVYARALEAGSTKAFLVGPAAKPVFRTRN